MESSSGCRSVENKVRDILSGFGTVCRLRRALEFDDDNRAKKKEQPMVIASFLGFLVLFTVVGVLSATAKSDTTEDYLVASRNVNPWLAALSAVSTNNSGYMFVGLIGFTYRSGISAMWITFGWILGDFMTWFWVHRRVREQSERVDANSVPTLLGSNQEGGRSRPVVILSGIVTFIFLGLYSAAQLKAGSAATVVLFGWPDWLGAVVGAVVVVLYCFAGGIRASIWTDAVQSCVMIGAMALLVGVCANDVGGPSMLLDKLSAIDPSLTEIVPAGATWFEGTGFIFLGVALYVIGFIAGGAGTVGQPHIIIRLMAIDSVESVAKARNVYFVWYTIFSLFAFGIGLYSRVLMPELGAGLTGAEFSAATERALPLLSQQMLPPFLIGVMLAGLFAATISTADSQVLACSAAITQDVFPKYRESTVASKVATGAVALVALGIALFASSGVFVIVLVAWSGLASILGPVLIIRLTKLYLPSSVAIVMMVCGLVTVLAWRGLGLDGQVFEVLPGMVFPLLIYIAAHTAGLTKRPSDDPT